MLTKNIFNLILLITITTTSGFSLQLKAMNMEIDQICSKEISENKNINLKEQLTIQLFAAIDNGDIETFKNIIEANPDLINAIDKNSFPLLHYACIYAKLPIIQYLIEEKKIDPNIKTEQEDKPGIPAPIICAAGGNLKFSTEDDRLKVIKYLIESANVEYKTKDFFGYSPIQWACKLGFLKIVKYFTEKDENILTLPAEEERSLILIACWNGHLNIAKYLIEKDNNLLYEAGIQNEKPFISACTHGHLDIVQYMVEKDESLINQKGLDKQNALHCCSRDDKNFELAKYLVSKNKGLFSEKDSQNRTPLSIACEHGCLKIIQFFMEQFNININEINKKLNLYSRTFYNYEFLKFILNKINDPNSQLTLETFVDQCWCTKTTLSDSLIDNPECISSILGNNWTLSRDSNNKYDNGLRRLIKNELSENDKKDPVIKFLLHTMEKVKSEKNKKDASDSYSPCNSSYRREYTIPEFSKNMTNTLLAFNLLSGIITSYELTADGETVPKTLGDDIASQIIGFSDYKCTEDPIYNSQKEHQKRINFYLEELRKEHPEIQ